MEEVSVLTPDTERFKLADGTHVEVEDLRLRQFLRMLRILTKSSLPLIMSSDLFAQNDLDSDEFARKLLGLILLALPDAEDETVVFLQSLVRPAGMIPTPLNKSDAERNEWLTGQLRAKLANPELEDTVTIFEVVIRREAKDIQALGKRLRALWGLASKTGLGKRPSPPSTTVSSAPSPVVSTSSAASTGGLTNVVWDSPSDGSDSASKPSGNDASTSSGETSNGCSGRPGSSAPTSPRRCPWLKTATAASCSTPPCASASRPRPATPPNRRRLPTTASAASRHSWAASATATGGPARSNRPHTTEEGSAWLMRNTSFSIAPSPTSPT